MTQTREDGSFYIISAFAEANDEGVTGPAVQRLAAFEDFVERLETEQAALAGELERMRLEGKKSSVRFREKFARKLTVSAILAELLVNRLN